MRDLVPVVDISGWESGNTATRRAIADQVDDACRRVGFMELTGHGVPPALVEATLRELDGFFALPGETKRRYLPPDVMVNRGYSPFRAEALAYSLGVSTAPDVFEAFNIGPDAWPAGVEVYERERDGVFAPNIWPVETPALRGALVAYFDAVAALARRMTRIFAVALGMPEDFFVSRTDHSTDTLRAIHYRAIPPAPADGTDDGAAAGADRSDRMPEPARMGAHTDYGILTILYGDRVPGLEIVGPDGKWHPVLPSPGAFLVNLGDLLAQWTNDRWSSTLHRVIVPVRTADGPARRRSIAFFHDGNHDAVVECLPTCQSPQNPPKYPPVVAGEHLRAKLAAPRTLRPTTATSTVGDRSASLSA